MLYLNAISTKRNIFYLPHPRDGRMLNRRCRQSFPVSWGRDGWRLGVVEGPSGDVDGVDSGGVRILLEVWGASAAMSDQQVHRRPRGFDRRQSPWFQDHS